MKFRTPFFIQSYVFDTPAVKKKMNRAFFQSVLVKNKTFFQPLEQLFSSKVCKQNI